jgi:limonene-1,2-epoxide hydrolase
VVGGTGGMAATYDADVTTPEEVVDEFIRRITSNELESALELVATDVEYDNVPIGKNIGPDGMREFLGQMSTGVDEIEFVIHRQVAAGSTVLNERSDRFHIGDKWLDLPVAGVFEVNGEGLITLWRDYFDMATFTNQLTEILGG